jgi:hypothetical protein
MPTDPNTRNPRTQALAAQARAAEPPGGGEAPALARHADPSLAAAGKKTGRRAAASSAASGRGGFEWVRILDLATGKAAGLGSRFGIRQESAVRRMRAAVNPVSRRGAARRSAAAAVLPPVSAFGAAPPPGRGGRGRPVTR